MSASKMLDVRGNRIGSWRRRSVFVLDGLVWVRNCWHRCRVWGSYSEWCDCIRDGRIKDFQPTINV